MKTKLLGITLFAITLGAVAWYPTLDAKTNLAQTHVTRHVDHNQAPVVDVVFVLDTTGSMGGLIQTAKEKIWSIASTMASAQPTPEIRIGLVGYRDRGDEYVTRIVDLSGDLDSVYAALMDFEANGGGDGPESVNQALNDAVNRMSWSQKDQAYQVIFLVGDAPPHMDYQDELQYPAIIASAAEKGIVVNTIQCGNMPVTVEPWTQIARLGNGDFFQVEQAGGAVAYTTPYDAEIADLAAKIDATRLYYGSDEDKARMEEKVAATEKLASAASDEALARRGIFNASAAGRTNSFGENELIVAVSSGKVDLDELPKEALPAAIAPMAPEEQRAYIAGVAEERVRLQKRIQELADERDAFIEKKVEAEGGRKDSLDQKLYDTVARQAEKAGLEYSDGPAY
ncbi:MAG: VWA domain-containing protein [Gammaproteobacteria bacterium]|nr:VWA domain-containing protein [Gammaproteobacteria bacterium]